MSNLEKWRGLAALVVDAVTHGSTAIERVQKDTAARPFWVIEQIAAVAPAARVVHAVHDASVSGVHGIIRTVARGVGGAVDLGIGLAVARKHTRGEGHDGDA